MAKSCSPSGMTSPVPPPGYLSTAPQATGGFHFSALFATEAEYPLLSLSDGNAQLLGWLLTE
jgi:hypothetical protein